MKKKFNIKHQTHFESGAKFILLFLIFFFYFIYLSYHHDISKGGITLALTWSFFVLCTPIADAGFLLDFPIRLLYGFRMFSVEVFVWILAVFISFISFVFTPEHFQTTVITKVFYQILCNPFPYWIIIFLCCIGTFTSIYFGDEMIDVIGHHERLKHHTHGFKYKVIVLLTVASMSVLAYYKLITQLVISLR